MRSELRWGSTVLRAVKRPKAARNIVHILAAFEEEGWPPRIDDPLPKGPDAQRLHATIKSLNCHLKRIRFHTDGAGEGVRGEQI